MHLIIPEENNNILKYNQDKKSLKTPFIIYAETKKRPEKIPTCNANPEESSKTEISKYTACGCSLFIHCPIDRSRKKSDSYGDIDCMKKFCADLKKHAVEMINYEKKDMLSLTNEEIESCSNQKVCNICKKFYGVDESDDDKFNARKFHGDASGFDDFDDYYGHNDDNDDSNDSDKLDARKFYDNAVGLDEVDDDYYDYNDSKFGVRKFLVILQNLLMLMIMMRHSWCETSWRQQKL